jgi:hypothetical protein
MQASPADATPTALSPQLLITLTRYRLEAPDELNSFSTATP